MLVFVKATTPSKMAKAEKEKMIILMTMTFITTVQLPSTNNYTRKVNVANMKMIIDTVIRGYNTDKVIHGGRTDIQRRNGGIKYQNL